jgi:hypothetical protein
LEKNFSTKSIAKLDIGIFAFLILSGLFFFLYREIIIKGGGKKHTFVKKRNFFVFILLFCFSFSVVLFCFFINLSKRSVSWDAISLYSARAKFLASGLKFSDMVSLSEYDNLNKYYYLLYPPFTSIIHFFWEYKLNLGIPVGVYYSITLFFLLLVVFYGTKRQLGTLFSLILCFLVVTNKDIFNISVIEYTNLPFTLLIVSGVFLVMNYIEGGFLWKYIFGVLLVSSSMWVRYLEPVWLPIVISFFVATFGLKGNKLKNVLLMVAFMTVCLVEYFFWHNFTSFAGDPSAINISTIRLLNAVLGLATGAWYKVLIVIINSWSIGFVVLFLVLVSFAINLKYFKDDRGLVFVFFVIFFSLLMYLGEYYLYSFMADDWKSVANSITRSSTFLIPLECYILLRQLIYFLDRKKNV